MAQSDLLSPDAKADIQGFVTSGYGHLPSEALLFVEVRDREQGRAWLRKICDQVTSAASWRATRNAPKVKPSRALNIAFTFAGLGALGLSSAALNTFPVEFADGMATDERARILGDTGDSAPDNWEFGGPRDAASLHAMLVLHAETRADLDQFCAEQRALMRETSGGVAEREGWAQFGERPAHGKEPFGFFDGVAQPVIKGIKGEGVSAGEFVLGHVNEYGFASAGPFASASDDPQDILPRPANPTVAAAGFRDLGHNGTFVVYRKLGQDVASFWRFLQAEAARFSANGEADPEFMVWLGAKMVGRWPSGAPLTLAPERDDPSLAHADDFLFAARDSHGQFCPVGSHIRRVNPRDSIRPSGPRESLHMSARHRLLRRGKPFGDDLFDLLALNHLGDRDRLQRAILDMRDDGQPRGIHFLCVNANIKSQFEFVQQVWSNNPRFNGLSDARPTRATSVDADPAGALLVPDTPFGLRTAPVPRFVTTRAGAYFFMPSLTALRFLAAMRAQPG